MTSVRKRKMNRSSVGKATRRVKDKHRKINVRSNPIIAANWDYNQTLAQNYKRLGLTVKLEKPAGGVEKDFDAIDENISENSDDDDDDDDDDADDEAQKQKKQEAVLQNQLDDDELDPNKIPEGEAKLVKNEKGEVVKIIYGKMKKFSIDNDEEEESQQSVAAAKESAKPKTKVVEELEKYAARPTANVERYQSVREKDWLRVLYEKHGDDYEAMKWDKKLNIFQNSAGDLKKKIAKWKKQNKF